jgi:hypothetical protein
MAQHSDRGVGNRPPAGPARPARPAAELPRATSETYSESPHSPPGATGAQGSGTRHPSSATPGVADEAREQAKTLASEAKEQTAQLAGEARQQIGSVVTGQKDRAAQRLGGLAGVLRDAASKFETEEHGGHVSRYTTRAADQIEAMSSYVRKSDVRTLIQDAGEFGRRRPEVFLGGTFLAGLVLARFLKASGKDAGRRISSAGGR